MGTHHQSAHTGAAAILMLSYDISIYKKYFVNKRLHGVNISIFISIKNPITDHNVMICANNWIASKNNNMQQDKGVSVCNACNDKYADIFQVEGEYCLDCWQKRTYPNV